MSYHAEIASAIQYIEANPPSVTDIANWPQSEAGVITSPESQYSCLYEQQDTVEVTFLKSEITANQVAAKDLSSSEFSSLLDAYSDVMGQKLDDELMQTFYSHERQHLEVAIALGAIGCQLVISTHLIPQKTGLAYAMTPGTKIGALETTKLGAALISCYPDKPSPDDLHDIAVMGYEGVDDVAERIIRQKQRPHYPLPLSYDLSSAPRGLRAKQRIRTLFS